MYRKKKSNQTVQQFYLKVSLIKLQYMEWPAGPKLYRHLCVVITKDLLGCNSNKMVPSHGLQTVVIRVIDFNSGDPRVSWGPGQQFKGDPLKPALVPNSGRWCCVLDSTTPS